MHSYYHGKLPGLSDNLVKPNFSVHLYNRRSASNIGIEFRRTNCVKFSIGFKGAIIWNNLPSNTRNISSYNMFATKSESM